MTILAFKCNLRYLGPIAQNTPWISIARITTINHAIGFLKEVKIILNFPLLVLIELLFESLLVQYVLSLCNLLFLFLNRQIYLQIFSTLTIEDETTIWYYHTRLAISWFITASKCSSFLRRFCTFWFLCSSSLI